MNEHALFLALVAIVVIVITYKLFFKTEGYQPENPSVIQVPEEQSEMREYLTYRLDQVREGIQQTEGYMQALQNVAHITDVSDKIGTADFQQQNFRNEERVLLGLLAAGPSLKY